MKFLLRLALIALGCYYLPMFAPWWIIFIYSAIIGYAIPGNGFNVFNAGFLGGGLVWIAMVFMQNTSTKSILTDKMVALFPIDEATYLLLITGLIGALCAATSAATGNSFRQIFLKKKKTSLYS